MSVLVETTVGDFVIDLFVKERPRCSLNFLKLCKRKYYNFSLFHSIEANYVAQTGDPTGTGKGGESINYHLYGEQARFFETENVPKLRHRSAGLLSMVNNGEDQHGSQWFITLADQLDYLDDGKHCVFGQIGEGGEELIEKLNTAICDQQNRPYQDIRIAHTIVLDDPFDDPKGLEVPSRSPSPSMELISSSRIAVDETVEEANGKTDMEIRAEIDEKETKARAHILEMIGDLHYAEEKPPDNVLFVCKLNPVTTEEDLEIIFSRFGPISGCEVIKDKKTGASLQYAFVEFEKPEHCENAYFKMDNVLIDDRRIHVDFSQSVSKNYQWKRQATAGTNGANEKSKQAAAVDDRSDHNRRRRRSSADVREGNRTQIYKRERSPDMKRRWRHDDKRSNEAHSRHRHRESSDRRRRSRSRDGRSGGRR